jgi:hypothetical protein
VPVLQQHGADLGRRMAQAFRHALSGRPQPSGCVLIGTDCPAVEPIPFNSGESPLHFRLLALLGMPLGELFILAPLAADCARDGRYEFMVVSAPMNVEGGIASPPNAVAIK